MKNWVGFVLMAAAYFIVFYVCYLITLFSNMEFLAIGCMAIGATIAQYCENKKKNK